MVIGNVIGLIIPIPDKMVHALSKMAKKASEDMKNGKVLDHGL